MSQKPHQYEKAGRPRAIINIPAGAFNYAWLKAKNPHVTSLTLRKFLKRDAARGDRSRVVRLNKTVRPSDGIGCSQLIYAPRPENDSFLSSLPPWDSLTDEQKKERLRLLKKPRKDHGAKRKPKI